MQEEVLEFIKDDKREKIIDRKRGRILKKQITPNPNKPGEN